ncbi:hypothetical protein C8R43DRAFT_481805 [Mycena crocata]|nr:hypothetical protein C8R43DRAFT_481805 [Mycena crocata]
MQKRERRSRAVPYSSGKKAVPSVGLPQFRHSSCGGSRASVTFFWFTGKPINRPIVVGTTIKCTLPTNYLGSCLDNEAPVSEYEREERCKHRPEDYGRWEERRRLREEDDKREQEEYEREARQREHKRKLWQVLRRMGLFKLLCTSGRIMMLNLRSLLLAVLLFALLLMLLGWFLLIGLFVTIFLFILLNILPEIRMLPILLSGSLRLLARRSLSLQRIMIAGC